MKLFLRQVWTLTVKNLLVVLVRPLFTTLIRALVLPVVFIAFMFVAMHSITLFPSNFLMHRLDRTRGTYSSNRQYTGSATRFPCDHSPMRWVSSVKEETSWSSSTMDWLMAPSSK